MKNQNENAAVSDVTARMREEARILSLLNGQSVCVASVAKKLREFAGSIDAAVSKTETTTPGNAAEMREALCDIVMLTMKVGYSIHGDVACGIIASKAKHALSEPARNCDRFSTWEDANNAFEKENAHRIGFMNLYTDVLKWLFSPSTERKGESDGSK